MKSVGNPDLDPTLGFSIASSNIELSGSGPAS